MRKEFEENGKKRSETNPDIQKDTEDEIFHETLKEEFIEREKQIEEALFADKDEEKLTFTEEEIKDSYQELLRRFEKEQKDRTEISAELVPDEKMLRKVAAGRDSADEISEKVELLGNTGVEKSAEEKEKIFHIEEIRNRREKFAESGKYEESASKITETRGKGTGRGKVAGIRWHRLGKVVGMAAVAVACVFAASMTSEANRKYLVNSVRIWSGDDTKTVVFNDNSNEDANPDEDKAIEDIEKKLGVEVPILNYRPYGMEFSNYAIDKSAALARIEYEYKEKSITLYIDKQKDITASKINSIYGDEYNTIIVNNDGESITIKKIYEEGEEKPSYLAEWTVNDTVYLFSGKMELEEIKKIIQNIKF